MLHQSYVSDQAAQIRTGPVFRSPVYRRGLGICQTRLIMD
jgi:hypothetical protein